MNKIIKLAAIAGFISMSAISVAQAAAPGFYLGGQIGRANMGYDYKDFSTYDPDYNVSLVAKSGSVDSKSTAGRVFAGYQFNQNWAAELGYIHYAGTTGKNIQYGTYTVTQGGSTFDINANGKGEVNQSAIDLVGKGILPVTDSANVYAKAGVAYVKAEFENTVTAYDSVSGEPLLTQKYKSTERKWRPTYAVGASMDVTPEMPIFIELSRIQKGSNIQNADLLSVGVAYHFSKNFL